MYTIQKVYTVSVSTDDSTVTLIKDTETYQANGYTFGSITLGPTQNHTLQGKYIHFIASGQVDTTLNDVTNLGKLTTFTIASDTDTKITVANNTTSDIDISYIIGG